MSQVMISLKPAFGELVLSGFKTVELRNRIVRIDPRDGHVALRYEPGEQHRRVHVSEIGSPRHTKRNMESFPRRYVY